MPSADGQEDAGFPRDGGEFSGEGLHSLEETDDILTAMARELVTEQGIGQSAEAIWRQLQTEYSRTLPPPVVTEVPDTDNAPSLPPALPASFATHGVEPCDRTKVRSTTTDRRARAGARKGLLPYTNSFRSSERMGPRRSSSRSRSSEGGHLPEPAISLDFRSSNVAVWRFNRFSSRLMRAISVFACRSFT